MLRLAHHLPRFPHARAQRAAPAERNYLFTLPLPLHSSLFTVRNVSEAPRGYAHYTRAPREAKCLVLK